MQGFHTLRMRAGQAQNLQDFELMTMILSALSWRKHNGKIDLVTDAAGKEYIDDMGISFVWDEIKLGLDILSAVDINENVFWAAGKLVALGMYQSPCAMLDLDFIVWKQLNFSELDHDYDVVTIHDEKVNNDVYPHKEFFAFKDGSFWQAFVQELDWQAPALNTAFAYFPCEQLRYDYCQKALSFMVHVNQSNLLNKLGLWGGLPYMVFAEQRLLAMLAKKYGMQHGMKAGTFSDMNCLFNDWQDSFTHVWGHKQFLKDNADEAFLFCCRCAARIRTDYHDVFDRLSKLEWFHKYAF